MSGALLTSVVSKDTRLNLQSSLLQFWAECIFKLACFTEKSIKVGCRLAVKSLVTDFFKDLIKISIFVHLISEYELALMMHLKLMLPVVIIIL